jgi:predicted secreted protein
MNYIGVKLSSRCEVFLTAHEINQMLMQNPEIFKKGISRGKSIRRAERFE